MTDIEQQQQQKEKAIFAESFRLIHLEGEGDELLEKALAGREASADNIQKLWKIVARALSASMSLPDGRCRDVWSKYWTACEDYLKNTAGWSDEQLKDLRYPKTQGSILEDVGDN